MKNTVVVGAQWGDEGKAKIVDLLSQNADVIIRYQGGCNAGHTVVLGDKVYKFHLIPSGILYENKTCFIGAGVVIHPETFQKEINELKERNIDLSGLKISPLATITMPFHIDMDVAGEDSQKKAKIGTTKKGIGPTYSYKIARQGLKIQDLYSKETLDSRLDAILPFVNANLEKIYGLSTYQKDEVIELCKKYAEIFKPFVCFEWQKFLKEVSANKTILFEGAQGVMLDVDYGTYPYVTSSNPIAGGACIGSGLGINSIQDVIGVFKAYTTRVGEGPFVTELNDEIGEKIRKTGNEFGTTTGRPRRCGWFDSVIARYSTLVSGLNSMALTKLDVFDDFDEIKICVAYKDVRNGKIYKDYVTDVFAHKYLEPVYETFEGWKTNISTVNKYQDLPEKAKKYLEKLEELSEVKIFIISVGADRNQTIFKN